MNDIPFLLDGLRGSVPILTALVETISPENLNRRRRPECWTIAEHVDHLADVQSMLFERLERFRDEAQPVFVPFFPGRGDEETAIRPAVSMEEALGRFSRRRQRQVDLLAAADPVAWRKTGTHPEYEHYTLHILARHILMHDHWHMYRMEELWLTRDEYLAR